MLFNALERVERGELKRLMVFMPPRHSKSEVCSIQFPAWFIGRNKDRNIIESSYSADLAVDFGRQVRNLVKSKNYQNIFDGVSLAEDSEAKGKWNTNGRGAYNAVGVGGATTGKGADVLIIDDPIKNRKDAESSVVRESTWDWYKSTARTRLSPNGAIVIVMTRWHMDDLAARILNNDTDNQWEIIDFPAIATHDEDHRKEGEALWADHFTLEILSQTKKDIGAYEWTALYQQKPISSETQEFKPEYYKYRTLEEMENKRTINYLTIDTAISQASSADNTGFCDNSVDNENFWTFKAWKMKISPLELIDYLFTLQKQRRYDKIGIEKTIYLQAIKPFIDEEQRRRGLFLPIVELQHNQTAKEIRIRALLPRYESGSIYHIKGYVQDLESEQTSFPKGVHDDVLDAAAYQVQIVAVNNNSTMAIKPKSLKI